MWRKGILSVVAISLLTAAAAAQESRSEISVQGTGFYTKDSTGQGIRQQATVLGSFTLSSDAQVKAAQTRRVAPGSLGVGDGAARIEHGAGVARQVGLEGNRVPRGGGDRAK